MGLCKGNLGNLMQHWVLCEVLKTASKPEHSHLLFVSTHGMAPWSIPKRLDKRVPRDFRTYFDLARTRLPVQQPCTYDAAWNSLTSCTGIPYPSSAVFVTHVWQRKLSLLICETDGRIAEEIDGWFGTPEIQQRTAVRKILERDWRRCFEEPLPLLDGPNLLYVECDPFMFEGHYGTARAKPGVLYLEDLPTLQRPLTDLTIPVIVQVSSYSPDNDNTPDNIEPIITHSFSQAKLSLQAKVVPNGHMTCLVYSRGLELWNSTEVLNQRFSNWLPEVA